MFKVPHGPTLPLIWQQRLPSPQFFSLYPRAPHGPLATDNIEIWFPDGWGILKMGVRRDEEIPKENFSTAWLQPGPPWSNPILQEWDCC